MSSSKVPGPQRGEVFVKAGPQYVPVAQPDHGKYNRTDKREAAAAEGDGKEDCSHRANSFRVTPQAMPWRPPTLGSALLDGGCGVQDERRSLERAGSMLLPRLDRATRRQ